jgi:hypothetical protein
MTPFGLPVLPEVNMTYAKCCATDPGAWTEYAAPCANVSSISSTEGHGALVESAADTL